MPMSREIAKTADSIDSSRFLVYEGVGFSDRGGERVVPKKNRQLNSIEIARPVLGYPSRKPSLETFERVLCYRQRSDRTLYQLSAPADVFGY